MHGALGDKESFHSISIVFESFLSQCIADGVARSTRFALRVEPSDSSQDDSRNKGADGAVDAAERNT